MPAAWPTTCAPRAYVLLEPGGLPLNRVAKTDYLRLRQAALAEPVIPQ